MRITFDMDTQNPGDAEALIKLADALRGDYGPAPVKKVAPATGKSSASASASSADAVKVTAPSQMASAATAEPPPTQTASVEAVTYQPAATGAGTEQASFAVPSEADLVAAANEAVKAVGAGGPDKVKKYIAEKFQKADGSPGTLKLTRDDQRAELLSHLQKIGKNEITL